LFISQTIKKKKKKKKKRGKIVNFYKNLTTLIVLKLRKKGKNEERDNRETRIGYMTERKRRQTLRSVAAFISKAE